MATATTSSQSCPPSSSSWAKKKQPVVSSAPTAAAAAAATAAAATTPAVAHARPTKYYFAYGSNLHIKQMNRRCPNSKFIGKARLSNYRWQINERGYANVTEAEGHWVDGLVYEIDETDEAKLDISEGVSKNAYSKRYMTVLLHRAQSALYRRPISWIVDKGGPAAVCKQVKRVARDRGAAAAAAGGECHPLLWAHSVLIYVNPNYIEDSDPRDEYVRRINLGIADARALGIDEDYIRNCIRPFIPETTSSGTITPRSSDVGISKGKAAVAAAAAAATLGTATSAGRGRKAASPARSGEPSPARKGRSASRPNQQAATTPRSSLKNVIKKDGGQNKGTFAKDKPPPLPPRPPPANQFLDIPVITVIEEVHISGWAWWPSF